MKIHNTVISESYKPVLLFAFLLQIFLLVFSSLFLDGGNFLRIACVGSLAFWSSALLIIVKNPDNPRKTDLKYIKMGPFLILVLAHIIIHAVWYVKGLI
jgi:hypothetical protein